MYFLIFQPDNIYKLRLYFNESQPTYAFKLYVYKKECNRTIDQSITAKFSTLIAVSRDTQTSHF